jgi:peptide/nickel transport system substrate-binding protein
MTRARTRLLTATILSALTFGSTMAEAAGILTIGRREDSSTFDPIATAQNIDNWVFSNVFDVLVRVDKTGTKLEPGLAESWTMSDDGLTYTFKLRDAKFSDGSPVTAEDAAFSLLRIRDKDTSLWTSSYSIVDTATATDPKTLTVKLKEPSVPFLSSLALPNVSVLPKKVVEEKGEEFASAPIGSGAFVVKEWRRGDRVILEKNPNFWQADKVSLDGIEWISVPDDNTRILNVQAGELDAAIFVPFSRVEGLKGDKNLKVSLDTSTREDSLLINHEHGKLADKAVREALDMAIDKKAIVEAVTFGIGEVANSYVPKGALYHFADNLSRPYDPEKAKKMLADAGASDLTLDYNVKAGDEVDEQIAVLIQQQLAKAGVGVKINKVDAASQWDMLVNGDYDIAAAYWTNDVLDPDQKTTFVVGHDTNLNYMTRYKNDAVKDLVAKARTEADPKKREAMYVDIQKMAKADVNWIDLYYSPYINVTRSNIEGFYQNPLGRFWLEDVRKN